MRGMIASVRSLLTDNFIRQKQQRNPLHNHESYPHIKEAHVKTECNYGKGTRLRAGQDALPTVSVVHFLNMSH